MLVGICSFARNFLLFTFVWLSFAQLEFYDVLEKLNQIVVPWQFLFPLTNFACFVWLNDTILACEFIVMGKFFQFLDGFSLLFFVVGVFMVYGLFRGECMLGKGWSGLLAPRGSHVDWWLGWGRYFEIGVLVEIFGMLVLVVVLIGKWVLGILKGVIIGDLNDLKIIEEGVVHKRKNNIKLSGGILN